MKKEIYTFIINTVAAISVTALVTAAAPKIGQIKVGDSAAAVFAPVKTISSVRDKYFGDTATEAENKSADDKASEAAATEQVTQAMSDDAKQLTANITAVPSDIQALMNKAQENIKKEKKVGKTSEEAYFGGGELVKSGGLEIQSKIPESFYKINAKKLLEKKADLHIADPSAPTVLIYHTHTTEAYSLLDVGYYTGSLDSRSNDKARNMVRVGDDICSYLNACGINTVHDTEIHDENYTGAYADSRKSVLKYLEKYPTIDITIDVHRDDITYENKTKVKPTAEINGKKAARMMIIAGAEYGSVKKYPDWEYNLRFVLAVQNKVNSLYPSLMRPVLFAERKYNMDLTHNSFLLEVGTDANTLDEATYSARMFAVALAELIKEDYVEK